MTSGIGANTSLMKAFDSLAFSARKVQSAFQKIPDVVNSLNKATNGAIERGMELWVGAIGQELRKAGTMWRDFNDQVIKDTRNLGLTIRDTAGYQLTVIKNSKELMAQYGITAEQMSKFQRNLSEATGRAALLNQQEREGMAAMSKLIGDQTASELIKNFDAIGGSFETAMAHGAQTYELAKRYGLNAEQTSAAFAKNIKLAETYTFANGIQGIQKMTLLSQKLKFDMQEIARSSEKFATIEGTIESAAKLQMLGGNMGAMFSNPMDAMYEAINDLEGFTDRVLAGFSAKGSFNLKTGTVDVNGLDKMFIKQQAEALGMSYESAMKVVQQQVRNKQVESELKGEFTEEQKAYVTSNAKFDMATGKHYIDRFNEVTKRMDKIYTDQLSSDTVKQLQDIAAPEEEIRGDVADIRRMLMKRFGEDAKSLVTQRELERAMREQITAAGAQVIDTPMNAYGGAMNWLRNSSVFRFMADGGIGTIATMALALPAWDMLKAAGRRATGGGFVRNIFRRGGGGYGGRVVRPAPGTYTATGGLVPSYLAEGPAAGESYVLSEAQAATKAAKGGKFLKFAKKGGKYALALAALYGGYKLISGIGGEEGAGPTQAEAVEAGGDVLDELKKHTVLLENLSGVKASELEVSKERLAAAEEEGNATVEIAKTALTIGAYTKTGTRLVGSGADLAGKLATKIPGVGGLAENALANLGATNAKISADLLAKGAAKEASNKFLTRTAGKALLKLGVRGGMAGPAGIAGAVVDIANMGMKSAGLYEEGSTTDKLMNIGSDIATGAAFGSMIGGPIGTAIGGAAGALYGIADQYGEELKEMASSAWKSTKDFLVGTSEEKAKSDADRAQDLFETQKIGATGIADPQLQAKAYVATIGIHDLLISKWNVDNGKYSNGAEKSEGFFSKVGNFLATPFKTVASLGNLASNTMDGISRSLVDGSVAGIRADKAKTPVEDIRDMMAMSVESGFPVRMVAASNRIPEMRSSSILASAVSGSMIAGPIGALATMIAAPFVGSMMTEAATSSDINVNVSGTIKLDLGGGNSTNIDAKTLLSNNSFIDKIAMMVSDSFQNRVSMGAGKNRSNPAMRGTGNTNIIRQQRI